MRAKMGVAIVVVIIAGLLVLPPFISKAMDSMKDEIVMQVDNSHAMINGEVTQMTDDSGEVIAPYINAGRTVAPLRWVAENLGLTVNWNSETQEITLVSENKKQDAVSLAIGKESMQIGQNVMQLDTPVVLKNNVTYVPVRAIGEAFGWNLSFVDAAKGGYIFLDNQRKAKEPTEKQIADAYTVLGPSKEQIMQNGIIARVGSDYVVTGAGKVQLQDVDGNAVAVVREDTDTNTWMPVQSISKVLKASVEITDSECKFTLANGDTAAIPRQNAENALDADSAINSNAESTETAEPMARVTDDVVYATSGTLASALGMHCTEVADGVVAITSMPLDEYEDQLRYIYGVGKILPDKMNIPKADAYIALTFDDGPTGGSEGLTVRLLNGLKERGVHATFFMCGYRIEDFHTHMDRYLAEGHQVGNHTYDHPGVLTKYSASKVYQQFEDNSLFIESYCGEQPIIGRPVGGGYNDMVLEQMKKAGLSAINWSLDTLDWKFRDAKRIKNVIVDQAKDGDIVLMHDLHQPTVDGVLAAIDSLQKKGFAFVTVSELAQVKGVTLEPGKLYTDFR